MRVASNGHGSSSVGAAEWPSVPLDNRQPPLLFENGVSEGISDPFGHSVLEQKRGLPVVERDAGPFCGAYTARTVTIGGDSHDRQRMAQETARKSAIVAGNPDDGLRLRSVLVRTVFEAARLPHLDI